MRSNYKKKTKRPGAVLLTWLVFLLMAASLVISYFGGRWHIPTWAQLYDWLGVYGGSPVVEPDGAAAGPTKLHFIDVGQGDAVLIEQNGRFALYDAGPDDCEESLLAYLYQVGAAKLDLVIMSHPHADHIGGMDLILQSVDVEQLWIPDPAKAAEPTMRTYTRILDTAEFFGTVVSIPTAGQTFPLGDGVITLVSDGVARPADAAPEEDGYNDLSLCIRFDAGDFSFLATGDGEARAEQALLTGGRALQADVFKAAHHGSYTSNSKALLLAVRPDVVVVSCGRNNEYGHPHTEALENYALVGADVYRTDLRGHIVIVPGEGDTLQVYTEQQEQAA